MNKVFCVSCGFKILYEISKPKFCSNCGDGLSLGSSAPTKEEEEVVGNNSLGVDIEKLKKGISVEGSSKKTTCQDIWGGITQEEAREGLPERSNRPASKDPEGQALLDQIVKECSSSRMRDVDEQ